MIPTVLGVILITFICSTSWAAVRRYDAGTSRHAAGARGFRRAACFNKPLFFGWWTKTRGWRTMRFERLRRRVHRTVLYSDDERRVRRAAGVSLKPAATTGSKLNTGWPSGPPFFQCLEKSTRIVQGLEKSDAGFPNLGKTVAEGPRAQGRWRRAGNPSLQLRRKMLNPLDSQLVFFLKQIARFDFGESSSLNQPVSGLLVKGWARRCS